jgi:hypothetical protein
MKLIRSERTNTPMRVIDKLTAVLAIREEKRAPALVMEESA